MIKKSFLFSFLFLIIFTVSVNAETLYYLNDSFDDLIDINDHNNWSYGASGCSGNKLTNATVPSIFGGYGLGANYSTQCGTNTYVDTWGHNFSKRAEDGFLLIQGNMDVSNSAATSDPIGIRIAAEGNGGLDYITFWLGDGVFAGQDFQARCRNQDNGCLDCSINPAIVDIDNFEGSFLIQLDLDNRDYFYQVTIEGNDYSCTGSLHSTDLNYTRIDAIQQWGNGYNKIAYYDDLTITNESIQVGADTCGFPTIFCDTFNYNLPMTVKSWFIFDGSNSVDTSFTPQDNKLNLTQDVFYSPNHVIQQFESNYPISAGQSVTGTTEAPVFSVEFDVNVSGTGMKYTVADIDGRGVIDFKAYSNDGIINWTYKDSSNIEHTICSSCMTPNKSQAVKIIAYFTKSSDFPFNSTNPKNIISLYINGTLINDTIPFKDNLSKNLYNYFFVKDDDMLYTIDNYYVYVGVDKNVDTQSNYLTNLYTPIELTDIIGSGEVEDLAVTLEAFWETFGLKSETSRTLFGVFMLVLFGLFFYGVGLSMGISVDFKALLILEFIFMILLVYIRLIPFWIPFVLGMVGAGLAAFAFKQTSGA